MVPLPKLGGLMLLVKRATASDFNGSATIFVSMMLHLRHPKVRFSKRSLPVSDRISAIRVEHLKQRGCSIAASGMWFGF
jgi:hypothetical protein